MIVGGEHYPSSAGKDLGILDDIYSDDSFLDAAIAYAEKVADVRPLPRVRDNDAKLAEAKEDPGIFDAMRKKIARKARNQRAPYACIEGVEAAVNLPFDDGLSKERELFKELVAADEAKSLVTPSSRNAKPVMYRISQRHPSQSRPWRLSEVDNGQRDHNDLCRRRPSVLS